MDYIYTDSNIDSSSRVPFRLQTDRQVYLNPYSLTADTC